MIDFPEPANTSLISVSQAQSEADKLMRETQQAQQAQSGPNRFTGPGSSMPGVPGTGNFMPTVSDTIRAMGQRNLGTDLQNFVLQNDSRVLGPNALMARAIAGTQAREWQQSPSSQFVNAVMASMMNTGFGGMLDTGGNAMDLMYGINRMTSGGMRANLEGGQANQKFYGNGAISAAASKSLFKAFENEFYTAGFANTSRTHGFDRSELGGLFAQMQQRGAFAGMNLGTVTSVKNPDGSSGLGWQLNESTKRNIFDRVSEAAGALRPFVNATGVKGAEAVQQLEQLTGESFADPKAALRMKTKMEQFDSMSRAGGASTAGMVSTALSLGGGPIGMRATTDALFTSNARQEQRRINLEKGIYTPEFSPSTIAAQNQRDISTIAMQDQDVLGASSVLETYSGADPAKREGVRKALRNLRSATTKDEENRARAELRRAAGEITGGASMESVVASGGGSAAVMQSLSPEGQQRVTDLAAARNQSRMLDYQGRQMINYGNIGGATMGSAFGGGEEGEVKANGVLADMTTQLYKNIDSETRTKYIDALKSGMSIPEANKILEKSAGMPTSGPEREAFMNAMPGMNGKAAPMTSQQLGNALQTYDTRFRQNPLFSNQMSEGDRIKQESQAFEATLRKNAFGDALAEQGGAGDFVKGVFDGPANIGSSQVLTAAKLRSQNPDLVDEESKISAKAIATDKGYALDVDKESAAKLLEQGMGKDKDIQATTAEELQEKLKDPATSRKARKWLSDNGYNLSTDQNGYITGAKKAEGSTFFEAELLRNEDGVAFGVDDKVAQKLMDAGMGAAEGLEAKDAKELQEKLKTTKGAAQARRWLEDQGYVMGMENDKTIGAVSKKEADKIEKAETDKNRAEVFKKLGLSEDEIKRYMADPGKDKELSKKVEDSAKSVAEKSLDDPDSDAAKSLEAIRTTDAKLYDKGMDRAIKAQHDKYIKARKSNDAAGMQAAKEKEQELKDRKEDAKKARGEEGGGDSKTKKDQDLLGTVKMVFSNELLVQLSHARGLSNSGGGGIQGLT